MTRLSTLLLIMTAALPMLLSTRGRTDSGRRVALLIGNSRYTAAPLPNCVNDAAAMEASLRRLGFTVVSKTDQNHRQMIEAIQAFGTSARGAALALFYYTGHGVQVGGKNFLVPVGANIRKQGDVEFEAVEADRVLTELKGGPTSSVIILDACRDNPLPVEAKDLGKGLIVKAGPVGSLVAFAASAGQTALARDGERLSIYTDELLKHLETPGASLETVFKQTRRGVSERTNGAQVPQELSELVEDVVLATADRKNAPTSGRKAVQDSHGTGEALTAGTVRMNEKDGAAMVYVPAGTFPMGSNDAPQLSDRPTRNGGAFGSSKPVHQVRISKGFWLYRTEVTNAQYRKFCHETGHREPVGSGTINGRYAPDLRFWEEPLYNAPGQPVVGVSWEDAVAYCGWAGSRLPTEAEWEYAARGTDGRRYPWGNQEPDASRVKPAESRRGEGPGMAGALPAGASPFGALDMVGSVHEWCADRFDRDYYRSASPEDPQGPQNGALRVGRGGSGGLGVHAAFRGGLPPDSRGAGWGFRPARTAE